MVISSTKRVTLPVVLLTVYLVLFLWLAISPHDRATWWAENLPVMITVLLLCVSFNKFQFSNTAYVLMWLFLCTHTIGGHFTFALVPFDWGNYLLGLTSADFLFPEGRNNFDRLGHFMVGFFAYPVAELAYRKRWVPNVTIAVILGIFALGFWGALYEVIEMIFAEVVGGDSAHDFLGSQGDFWDAQKDMALDILGAVLVSVLFIWVWSGKTIIHTEY